MENVVEKIKKLLAMAGSSNRHEAEVAMAFASRFMAENNITHQDLEKSGGVKKQKDYANRKFGGDTKLPTEAPYVFAIIQEFCSVGVFTLKKNSATTIYFVGDEGNIEIAEYIYNFLCRKFRQLWYEYKDENFAPATHKKSFYAGLLNGIKERMKYERMKVQDEMKSVVVYDREGIFEAAQNIFKKPIKKGPKRTYIRDDNAFDAGYTEGRHLEMNPALKKGG